MSTQTALANARFCHKFAYSGCYVKNRGKHTQQMPHNEEYHLGTLMSRARTEDIEKAVNISNLLKEKEEECHINSSMYHRYQGEVLLVSGKTPNDFSQSEQYFIKSLELNPENEESHHHYARLLAKHLNKKEEAKQHYLKALSIRPNDSVINWDYANFLLENEKAKESLEYFDKVTWTEEHFTTQDGYASLAIYFEALIECNKFDDYFKLRNKIVLENMCKDTQEAIVEWDNMGNKLIKLRNEIGDMLDPDNNDNNLSFESWWNDKVNIVTLLKKIELFDNDDIKPLCKYLENQMKQENDTNEEQQDIDVMNSNDNNNHNDGSCDENKKNLKKQECLNVVQKLIGLCQACGVSQSEWESILHNEKSQELKNEKRKNNCCEKENGELEQLKMKLENIESLCQSFETKMNHIDNTMNSPMDYKVERYQAIKILMQQIKSAVTSELWQKETGNLLNNLFTVKNEVSKIQIAHATTNIKYNIVATKTRELESEWKALKERFDNVTKELQKESFGKYMLKQQLDQLSNDLKKYQTIEKGYENANVNFQKFCAKSAQYYDAFEDEFEKHWQKKEAFWYWWSHHDIASWMIYQLETKITDYGKNEMTYQYILSKLKDEKYKAKYLQNMTIDDLLNDFGFEKSNESKYEKLIEMIEQMCEKYPMPKASKIKSENQENENNEDSNSNNNNSDINKYCCPITGDLMKHPVIGMDGVSYEKQNIIDYLRTHKRFPNGTETNENAELAILLLQENVALKKEIALQFDQQPPFKKARH